MIPKKIHLTYATEELSSQYQENLNAWKRLYSDWDIHYYSDAAVYRFFERHFPEFFLDLPNIQLGAVLADVFRYGVLYVHGGMYTDIDTVPLKKIPEEWLQSSCILGYEYQPDKFPEMFRNPYREHPFFCQWTMLAAPRHPLFEEALSVAFDKLRACNFHLETPGDVLETTGPLHLTSLVEKTKETSGLLILDADYFGCNEAHHLPLTERSLIHHHSDGCQGWYLQLLFPHFTRT